MPETLSSRVFKFDVGSPTDLTLAKLQKKLDASTGTEALRRSLTIADAVTDLTVQGRKIFVQGEDGQLQQLLIS